MIHTNATAITTLAKVLWFTSIAIACLTKPNLVGGYTLLSVGVIFTVISVAGILVAIVVGLKVPIPVSKNSPSGSIIITLVMTTLCVVTIAGLIKSPAMVSAQINDFRAGGLLALTAFGLILLSRGHSSQSVFKETLVELRQDIVLGDLSAEDAFQRTRIALKGMFLSDFAQEDTRMLLGYISDVRAIYSDAFQRIEALRASIPIASPKDAALSDIQRIAVSNTLDLLEACAPKVQEISKQYFESLKSVKFRLGLASRLVKAASSDEAKIMSEVRNAHMRADVDQERFISEFEEIQNAWNTWYPMQKRQHRPFV